MKKPLAELKKEFDDYFMALVDRILEPYPEEYHYLKTYILQGGKQVRPLLFLEACTLWGKQIDRKTLHIASGIELVHNFFLIHDDIMDNDEVRRDQPTLHTYFAKNRSDVAGRALALVLGDLIYTEALKCMCEGSSDDTLRFIQEKTLEICSHTANGQILEFTSNTIPTKESLFNFYRKKTAEYSIYFPLILAAYHSHAESKLNISLQDLLEVSNQLGIAYQLYDDVSEIVGAKKRIAHSERCSDIMRAKMTPILVDALPLLSENLRKVVENAYITQQVISEEEEQEILSAIHNSNILKNTQDVINKHLEMTEVKLPSLRLERSELIQKLLTTYRHAPGTSA